MLRRYISKGAPWAVAAACVAILCMFAGDAFAQTCEQNCQIQSAACHDACAGCQQTYCTTCHNNCTAAYNQCLAGCPTPTPTSSTPTPTPTPKPTGAPLTSSCAGLKRNTFNPHYFRNGTTQQPVLIASYMNLTPVYMTSPADSDPAKYYPTQISTMLANDLHWARVWHLATFNPATSVPTWPWTIPGGGGCLGPVYNLDAWNASSPYVTRMSDALARASSACITSELMLFDTSSIVEGGKWTYYPWAAGNNIQALGSPGCSATGSQALAGMYSASFTNARFSSYLKDYASRMIAVAKSYNVVYEIENEHDYIQDPAADPEHDAWPKDWASFVKAADPGHLVSYSSSGIPNQPLTDPPDTVVAFQSNSGVDIVNRHYGQALEADPSLANKYIVNRWGYNKPINIDEFGNGHDGGTLPTFASLRTMAWVIVSSGGHFHIEDTPPTAQPVRVVRNIHAFVSTNGWNFSMSKPVLGPPYCMRPDPTPRQAATAAGFAPGPMDYVCYYPTGAAATVAVPNGTYAWKWWNPRWDPAAGGTGVVSSGQQTVGDGTLDVPAPPNTSDFVLHARKL